MVFVYRVSIARQTSGYVCSSIVTALLTALMGLAGTPTARADTPCRPSFTAQGLIATRVGDVKVESYSVPAFADLDGDKDQDAVVGGLDGGLRYFENVGTPLSPEFNEQTGAANPFGGIDVGSNSCPAFADIDDDGDQDCIVGKLSGSLSYFENTGTPQAPIFTARTGESNVFGDVDVGFNSSPRFVDLDGDGDLDVVIGEATGTLNYLKNVGTSLVPIFFFTFGGTNPFDGLDSGDSSAPAFADLDGDGDQDALVGESNGTLICFQNVGTALAPVFTEQVGDANPFNGVDLGDSSTPSFVDLDGDGVLDAAIGESGGALYGFQNTSLSSSIEITLVGAAAIALECACYTEAGATAKDGCGRSIEVTIGGDSVDVATPGTYVVTYDASDGINAAVQQTRTVTVGVCSEGDGARIHTADKDANHKLSLSEMLRVIQFYNSGALHCAEHPCDTEDGYVPGSGAKLDCAPHSTDYAPQNWIISLSELLRLIQFYNVGGYAYCPDQNTEDGFCAVAA